MSHERYYRAKEIFLAARGRPQEERDAFVSQACSSDAALRREVDSLLDFLDCAGGALVGQGVEVAETPGPPRKIANYRIVRKLGEGGMGVVYEAEQESPIRRTVALKVIRSGMDSARVIARFETERQALALMSHPSIARVLEAGATGAGQPYFAMEYVAGSPITDYCDLHRLELRQRLELFVELCLGVEHAHRKGIIHRDIKPSNVLVTDQDGQPVPKLIDFGVARATERHLTEQSVYTELGEWIGTPEYMSPEQAGLGGDKIDARTDVYSLGALLYELLTGAQAIDPKALRDAGFDGMRRILREQEPERPSVRLDKLGDSGLTAATNRGTDPTKLRSELRSGLDWIVMTAMAKQRDRRYVSASELAADVSRFLRAEPILAGSPSVLYRLSQYARRHRVGVVVSSAALAALLLGIGATSLWLRQPQPSQQESISEDMRPLRAETQAEPSLAVLPFVNLSDDSELDYFSDGLSEELLNALAQIPTLRVAARTSSFAYKNKNENVRVIGQALAVTTILEGSVRRSGDTLRIVAQLIDTEDGFHLWSDTFEREMVDVFEIQDEISAAVAQALEVQLLESPSLARRSATTVRVYDLFLRARQRLRDGSPTALAEASALFEDATRLDPTFAPAYAGLAESYLLLARNGDLPMATADRQAMAALAQALELDSELAEAHVVVGLLRSMVGDGAGAESALRRAIELNGSLAEAHRRLGNLLISQNRRAEADTAYSRALALDPLNKSAYHAVAITLMDRGGMDDGILRFQQWLRVDPESAETYRLMSLFARTYGQLDKAVSWARRAVELDPQAPLNLHELIMAHSALGEFDRAGELMDQAYRQAPNNHWTATLKAFMFIESGDLQLLEEFTQQQLTLEPLPQADPLPQVARVRLALAGRSKVYQRQYEDAVELYERALSRPFTGILEIGFDADALLFLAFAYQRLDRSEDADVWLRRSLELVQSSDDWIWAHLIMPGTLAGIYAVQGRLDDAVEILSTAVADGYCDYWALLRTPYFDDLRQRDDFRLLVARVKGRLEEMRTPTEQ